MSHPRSQLELALPAIENRGLFSDHFLRNRLSRWPEFESRRFTELYASLRALWEREGASLSGANEAQTEERFVKPVLHELGFAFTVQPGLRVAGGRRQPDYALFLSDEARTAADGTDGAARYTNAVAVLDAKRLGRPLDRRESTGASTDDPVAQIINYVLITKRRWGILTDGRIWRLYGAERNLIEGAYWQVDLVALLEQDDVEAFAYFAAFFGASAFSTDVSGRSFLDRALEESRANAIAVGAGLERQIFAAVPQVAQGLMGDAARSVDALATALDHALVFLYRLLFCLYAEGRRLLPVDNPHYRDYSLRRQAEELARDRDHGRRFSSRSDDLYGDLRGLFAIVDQGDEDLGVNEYDGGLFSGADHPWLTGRSVPDSLLAPALDGLYRLDGAFVDYGDLSPRHLGTIYERLLDYRLEAAEGGLFLAPATGRHESGSYYTPDYVVDAIVEATLEPLLAARSEANAGVGLRGQDALDGFLSLRVLDPAMGSGHFLVSAAGYIAQYIATDPSYDGDLPLVEIQRLVAERCLYGVDLNPMAVELARLSLWLTTVRGDEPLTFLHNLRDGNSLVGAELSDLLGGEASLFTERFGRDARDLLARIDEVRRRESRVGSDVHEKERLAELAEELRRPLEAYADETVAPAFGASPGRFLHWQLEFPEVFLTLDGRPRDDGGFDAVIGNPPYVRIQELGRELAEYCRRRYATAKGSFDVYVPFLERSLELLARNGRLGFIVPNKLLKLDYGQGLRARLAEDGLVEQIVDFGDAQLFPGATNYTCILVLDRVRHEGFAYRRVRGRAPDVRRALIDLDAAPSGRFEADRFGADPWILATGEEAALVRTATEGSERLGDVTGGIFTGLQTSADPVYILEDRGERGGRRMVYSKASGRELELEPELLHPLASGTDVERYAFRPLRQLLLFPYGRTDGKVRLLSPAELAERPLTESYLREHEEELRGRERGKMDRAGWYGYVYPKSLGAHDLPKLGVAATVRRLEVAADPEGAVYFHNVRVNGILARDAGPSVWLLTTLLNARLLDYVFRRLAAPHAGGHYAANKQFIAPLPVRVPDATEAATLEELGRRLHASALALMGEREGFLRWLADTLGASPRELAGATRLAAYDTASVAELLAILRRNRNRLGRDPETRSFTEALGGEHEASVSRLGELRRELDRDEAAADAATYELYELTAAQRKLVDDEYRRAT